MCVCVCVQRLIFVKVYKCVKQFFSPTVALAGHLAQTHQSDGWCVPMTLLEIMNLLGKVATGEVLVHHDK